MPSSTRRTPSFVPTCPEVCWDERVSTRRQLIGQVVPLRCLFRRGETEARSRAPLLVIRKGAWEDRGEPWRQESGALSPGMRVPCAGSALGWRAAVSQSACGRRGYLSDVGLSAPFSSNRSTVKMGYFYLGLQKAGGERGKKKIRERTELQ